jgi:uncharacterized membrane protein YuzA (DUF378 family)
MKKGGMCVVHKLAAVLLVVGGLNWGAIGLGGFAGADWNLVRMLLGAWPAVEWVVYILVGVSALAMLGACKCCMTAGMCSKCENGKCDMH